MSKRTAIALTLLATVCGLAGCSGDSTAMAAKKQTLTPAQKQIWTSTAGTVAMGSPLSQAGASGLGQTQPALVDGVQPSVLGGTILNQGCPTTTIPGGSGCTAFGCPPIVPGAETVVVQGTMSAPAGTTAMWDATVRSTVVFGALSGADISEDFQFIALTGYIGKATAGCVDFASCAPSLTRTPLYTVEVVQNIAVPAAPVVQNLAALLPSDAVVFFVTATITPGGGIPPGGMDAPAPDGTCLIGAIDPLAHSVL